ncbi:hypothetical protein M3223_04150 [Paenibacillus pasadenensis]|uniref:hypothetical protein n=1 Tax=Paenibacillus pasadenensis TaxID=217090 RepID=UPI00203CA6B7|nr:hypothetical protein [Paenibacillus pasadenensis]MCM3746541.1 hypothetical protein [Paenibacillus pasadenensis]
MPRRSKPKPVDTGAFSVDYFKDGILKENEQNRRHAVFVGFTSAIIENSSGDDSLKVAILTNLLKAWGEIIEQGEN